MTEHSGVSLSTPIEQLKSVGSKNLPRLRRLGITSVRHLLWHFPARYEDYSRVVPIAELEAGQKVNIQGEVIRIISRRIFPRRMTITDAVIRDQSGSIRAVWFNQPYIANSLMEGSLVSLAGKVGLNKQGIYLASPVYERIVGGFDDQSVKLKHTGGLIPTYPETEGVTSKYLRFLVKPLLENISMDDFLDDSIRSKYDFLELKEAVKLVHYPNNLAEVERAKERLAFDELLLFQLKALLERRKLNQLKSTAIPFDQKLIQDFVASLPFELTRDQKVAAYEILKDLAKPYPMNRLLEGDVGSGKTVVALIGAIQAASAGLQTVIMAPTEVLALQHFETIKNLTNNKIKIAVLTGSGAYFNADSITKTELKKKILTGQVDLIIGTHAVIQKDVKFKNLALVVIDEQHRFGIEQRASLLRSIDKESIPHLLSMTATPIPRTLALTIFGDLDISIIKEKPANRQKIITKIVKPTERKETYEFIRQEVANGRQVFVICPRIEKADPENKEALRMPQGKPISQAKLVWAEVKAVEAEHERLSKEIFPDLKVAMLHGKMKQKEKNSIMHEFKAGWHDILVSTSVIEVGVDVPNASIMMIEGADRFGLAQLHQFRGRVGRAEHQSYCFLLSTGDAGIGERLKALVQCDDGFELAEKDMAIRGPGEFFGIKQSGMPDLTMASLANVELIKKARLEARLLLKESPSLDKYPLLRERLEGFQNLHHFE